MNNTEHTQKTDEELVRETQAGSLSSFEELVIRYEVRLFHFMKIRSNNEADAEDLVQECFLKAFRNINRFKEKFRFQTWLYTIARRNFNSYYRRRRFFFSPLETGTKEMVDPHHAQGILEKSDSATAFWKQIQSILKNDQFSAVWLKYHDEMSVEEIAQILGKTVTGTKVMLHRARKQIKEKWFNFKGDEQSFQLFKAEIST